MLHIIERKIRMLLVFLLVLFMHGTVLGDIPPLPPEIPGTQIELPTTPTIVVVGLLLSGAVALAGVMAGKGGNSFRKKIGLAIGVSLLVTTIAAAVFAYQEHSAHVKQTGNWRPLGPVEQFDEATLNDEGDTSDDQPAPIATDADSETL